MASTEAQKKASAKWSSKATVAFTIRFNKEKEAEMIAWIESRENKSKAIKEAIRKMM